MGGRLDGVRLGGIAVVLAVAVAGLAGCASSGSPSLVSPSSASSTPASAVPAGHRRQSGIAGQITAVNGSTWTVAARSGKQYTVDITSGTMFGTKQHPATQGQFVVGSQVRIAGTINGSTVTATRVVVPTDNGGSSTAPTPSATPTG